MAHTFSVEEIVHKPGAEVWTALTDWPNAHHWMPGVDRITAQGETAQGTELTFRARGADRSSTIVECVAGRSMTLRSTQGAVTADYAYEVQEHGEGSCRVTLTADCQITSLWLRLVSPLLRIAIRMSDGKQIKLLKAIVEGD